MKSALSQVNYDRAKGKRIAFVLLLAFFLMPVAVSYTHLTLPTN